MTLFLGNIKFPDFSLIWGIFIKFPDFSWLEKVELIFQVFPDFQVEWEPCDKDSDNVTAGPPGTEMP